MFGVDTSELLLVAVLALIFIGPKDLPNALRTLGRFVGQVRGMARHFQSGIDAMIREAELAEMEKKWREENERIMRDYPALLEGQRAEAAHAKQPDLPLDSAPGVPDPLNPPSTPPETENTPEKRELP
ncbi:Sec-independent protein translocase protein TatB [Sphingomonas sp. SM33]|uniref:Sec-independent protein translocase protein TatB n=1 Tax=Sphingomonas telluris TaxID=2907998 RepID=A0ABS9VNG2_9SPHN|nr:Sec-independent protein translocase protein TatB [Sphingomonas telluris]MCH8616233.1 Sec-independent protein translocase protein TatB [Sphingomonas telluris]